MDKIEVYSWRLDPELKQRLSAAARDEKTSIGGLLDRIAREWLQREPAEEDDEAMQRRIRAEAAKWIGSIQGNAIVAIVDAGDVWHRRCREALNATPIPLATNAAALAEVFHLLAAHEVESAWKFLASGIV